MAKYDYYMKVGNTYPPLEVILKEKRDGVSAAIDLTGCTVACLVKDSTTGLVKGGGAATPDPDQTTYKGKVKYTWVHPGGKETDTAGVYRVEWVVTRLDGSVATHPNNDKSSLLLVTP